MRWSRESFIDHDKNQLLIVLVIKTVNTLFQNSPPGFTSNNQFGWIFSEKCHPSWRKNSISIQNTFSFIDICLSCEKYTDYTFRIPLTPENRRIPILEFRTLPSLVLSWHLCIFHTIIVWVNCFTVIYEWKVLKMAK